LQTSEASALCEFCGLPISEDGQTCPALHDGECKTTEQVLAEPEVAV
jgi:hypothetical protein